MLIAGPQALEGVRSGEAALDHPALSTQAGAVRDPAAGDSRSDATGAQLSAALVVVVAAVGEDLARSSSWPTTPAGNRWHRVGPADKLGAPAAVVAGEGDSPQVSQSHLQSTGVTPLGPVQADAGLPVLRQHRFVGWHDDADVPKGPDDAGPLGRAARQYTTVALGPLPQSQRLDHLVHAGQRHRPSTADTGSCHQLVAPGGGHGRLRVPLHRTRHERGVSPDWHGRCGGSMPDLWLGRGASLHGPSALARVAGTPGVDRPHRADAR